MAKKPKTKNERIAGLVARCAAGLEAEGVKYFIGIVDRDEKDAHGGKAYSQSDCKGEDMEQVLAMMLPTNQDLISMGIWLGRLIQFRKEQKV